MLENLDIRVVQQGNQLDIVMRDMALGDIGVFQLPDSCVFWGQHMLGSLHRLIISARNGDVVFVSLKFRYI